MLRGNPADWHVGGSSSGACLVYGRQFFFAKQDEARCLEQLQVLALERVRLHEWVQHTLDGVQGAVMRLQEDGVQIEGKEDWEFTSSHGRLFWLQWHEQRLLQMKQDGSRLKLWVA